MKKGELPGAVTTDELIDLMSAVALALRHARSLAIKIRARVGNDDRADRRAVWLTIVRFAAGVALEDGPRELVEAMADAVHTGAEADRDFGKQFVALYDQARAEVHDGG